ncbi:TonB-dependent receptor [Leeuwenhoekiella marinoflava]|uniref:SusC/RagA family TonB-linked outer membrane protein n=1 Tax=Leeuwenhoekiella marinoflava TaxID=988 RepID=UPI003001C9B6
MIRKLFFMIMLGLLGLSAKAQQKTVTGTVADPNGMPLPGVNVVVKNAANRGAQTDFDGNFSIAVSPDETLVFSFLGFESAERAVGQISVINITLNPSTESLDEVVVVGYGVQRKADLTASVSQVKGEAIANLVTPSFESQLAGRAAGVQMTTQSGIIGDTPRFRIRGIASIDSGTYPLVVVDGIPIATGGQGGYASSNALGDINPADIESIDILKDGSATAIYGSRAANGVVLITTKKGKVGKISTNYNVTVGFARPVSQFDLLGAADFVTISNEKRSNRSQSDWAAGTELNTNWQDLVLNNNAFQQDHNLSFSGGTENLKYYLSLGFTEQESVAKPNEFTRFTYRANAEQKIKDWVSIGANAGITQSEYFGLNVGTNSLSGNVFNATRQHPNVSPYDANDPTGYNLDDTFPDRMGRGTNLETVGDNIPNIIFVVENNKYATKINRLIGNTYLDIKPVSTINFRTQISVDKALSKGYLFWSPIHGDGRGSNGRVQNNSLDETTWNWQNVLSYNETYADAHNLSVTLVNEYQKTRAQSFFGTGTDLSNEFFGTNLITDSYGVQGSGGGITENGLISYAARLSYNFKERYYLQGTIRRDGLSRLSADTRYGNFPGASVGWRVSEEPFMEGIKDVISELKLRGSYGKVGNTDIGNYPYLGLYAPAPYAANNGIGYSQFGNNTLQWETSAKYDAGFDLSLFRNKINFSFDYFLNDIDGLILDVETPQSFGVPNNSYRANIGQIENSGLEFTVDARIIDSDFTWNVGANISFIENEIISLVNGADRISSTNNTINREGESINSIYGYRYYGVNPSNGNPVYYKADGSLVQGNLPGASYSVFDPANPADVSTAAALSATDDRTILGRSQPKYFGGFNSNMTFKNFDLGFLFRFSGGNQIFNATRRDLLNQNFTNNSTEILGRWQSVENPGDGWTPRLYASTNTTTNLTSTPTTRFVEDADFIKLDNVTLGYSLPMSEAEKLGLTKLRLFLQGQNLWTITDYSGVDPEMETAGVDLNLTPRSSVFSFGINVGF